MKLLRKPDGWWIVKIPDTPEEATVAGPYKTKEEAQEDLEGLMRFYGVEYPASQKLPFPEGREPQQASNPAQPRAVKQKRLKRRKKIDLPDWVE